MMTRLGQFVAQRYGSVALLWGAACALLFALAPDWSAIVQNDEFAFLRADCASREAEEVFRRAFPLSSDSDAEGPPGSRSRGEEPRGRAKLQDPLRSNLVIVVRRKDIPRGLHKDIRGGLQPDDFEFLEQRLRPRLQQIAATTGRDEAASEQELPLEDRIIRDIWTPTNLYVGPLLESESNESVLVVLELGSELVDRDNDRVISRINELLNEPALKQEKPPGLDLVLSGTAVVGRDVLAAESLTARRMEWWTLALLTAVLTWLHRAPLLSLVALGATVLAVHLTIDLVGVVSAAGGLRVSTVLLIYLKGVGYAAGAQYSVMLLATYRQLVDQEESFQSAVATAIARTGPVLLWTAGAAIAGLVVLTAADFGKLRQAGAALPLAVGVAWLSAVTLLPALLAWLGRLVFWPDLRHERISTSSGWMPTIHLSPLVWEAQWQNQLWSRYAAALQSRTATLLLGTFVVLLPLAVSGALQQNDLSYGMLSELPAEDPSVIGAKAVQDDFPDGIIGPTTLLIRNPALELEDDPLRGRQVSEAIASRLWSEAARLRLADVRCEAHPWGMSDRALQIPADLIGGSVVGLRSIFPAKGGIMRSRMINKRAHDAYTSTSGELAGQVLRIDLVFSRDPFTDRTIEHLTAVEQTVRESLPPPYRAGTAVHALGPTASLRDLKAAADGDRKLLIPLAAACVFVWLSLVLRRPVLCGVVVLTVVLVGLAALGLTRAAFAWPFWNDVSGLDWRVPVLAMTLVIALGSSLSVPLLADLSRRRDDVRGSDSEGRLGRGVTVATGMATAIALGSLMVSPLSGLAELGVALAWGVVLCTLVVQLLVIPAWMVLVERPRGGAAAGRSSENSAGHAAVRSETSVAVGE